MKIKKLLIANLILFILILITVLAIKLFNNYLYSPYDALNDLREIENEYALDESEIPNIILKNGDRFVEDYQKALEEKNVKNLKIVRAYTVFEKQEYPSIYIVVDTQKNKVISNINLIYSKNGELKSLTTSYRELNDEDFLLYNECLINMKSLNLPSEIIGTIKKYASDNPKGKWNVGSTYKYEYSYREPTAQFYTRIIESRWVLINLSK